MYYSARARFVEVSFVCQSRCKKWDVFIFVVLVIGAVLDE